MNHSTSRLWKKVSVVVVASVWLVNSGGAMQSATFASENSASVVTSTILPDFSTPERVELINLLQVSGAVQLGYTSNEDKELWTLAEYRSQALAILTNPNPNSAQLFAAHHNLERSLKKHMVKHFGQKLEVEKLLHQRVRDIQREIDPNSSTPTEVQQANLDLIAQTQTRLGTLSDHAEDVAGLYREYLSEEMKILDQEAPDLEYYEWKKEKQMMNAKADISWLARYDQQLNIDTGHRAEAFYRSRDFLESLLASPIIYPKSVYEVALDEFLMLSSMLGYASYFADTVVGSQETHDRAPRGLEPGQYPASAFGALNRAVNLAKRQLETAPSVYEMQYGLLQILNANDAFRAAEKPYPNPQE